MFISSPTSSWLTIQTDNTLAEVRLEKHAGWTGSFNRYFIVLVKYDKGRARYEVMLLPNYTQPGEVLVRGMVFLDVVERYEYPTPKKAPAPMTHNLLPYKF